MVPFLILCSMATAHAVKAPSYGPFERSFLRLDHHMQSAIKKGSLIGAAVAVVENGHVAFIKGYGNRKKGQLETVDGDTVFQFGSLSKSITASLFAVGMKQNKLSLDAPVIADGWILPHVHARHVLNHTSGFSRAGFNWQIEQGRPRGVIKAHLKKKHQRPSGASFDYHNFVYSLIEDVIENAYQDSFPKLLTHHVLRPIGMSSATVGYAPFNAVRNRAWPHELDKKGRPLASDSCSYRYHDAVVSSGGINGSIKDASRLLLLQLGHLPSVLSSADLAEFHSPQVLAPDAQGWFKNKFVEDYTTYYGYGFRIVKKQSETLVFHGGWVKGFRSIMMFSPQNKRGIVILSNVENREAFDTAVDFMSGKL